LIHGFTGSRRVWELVVPRLERRFELLVPTLPGHFGGPPLPRELTPTTMVEAVERMMDEAGWETAHVAGNSLGGYVALQLGARGRARSVTAFAPAGGWASGKAQTLAWFEDMHQLLLPQQVIGALVEDSSHITPELFAGIVAAARNCVEAPRMIELGHVSDWPLGPVECPLRFVWGTEDKLLPWPSAAARYQREMPQADWVVLDGVGHCPQLELPLETAELVLT
jgi:pimeloyl-ACP methyl ester carboxylesterase